MSSDSLTQYFVKMCKIYKRKQVKPPKKNSFCTICKSFIGFSFGVLLTYFFYYIFTTQFNVDTVVAKWISFLILIPLSIGCSASLHVRCTIFLFLPHFFSKRGRTALITYAFALSVTGPTKNVLLNMEILGQALSCVEDELNIALSGMMQLIKTPLTAIKQLISNILHHVKQALEKVKKIVMTMVTLIHKICNYQQD